MLPVNSSDLKVPQPEYKSGDIVYIAFSPKHMSCFEWPAIDSPYEVDCKILEIIFKANNPLESRYTLISGNGAYLEASGMYLIHPKNKHLYGKREIKKLVEGTELCPAGTTFFDSGEYWCNEEYGMFIHQDRMSQITNLFT